MYLRNSFLFPLLFLTACTHIDREAVRAVSGAPESARVDVSSVPYDSHLPRYVLVVDPVRVRSAVYQQSEKVEADVKSKQKGKIALTRSSTGSTYAVTPQAEKVAAQLVSALTEVGNFSVMSDESAKRLGNGRYKVHGIANGEVGPFIVRAAVTEYSSVVEQRKASTNLLVFNKGETVRRGVVGLDVQIIDGRDGSIAASFPVQGTFSSEQQKSGTGLLPIYKQEEFAQSVMDQALRVTLNEAASEILDRLSAVR